jgi:hypothetical protein
MRWLLWPVRLLGSFHVWVGELLKDGPSIAGHPADIYCDYLLWKAKQGEKHDEER